LIRRFRGAPSKCRVDLRAARFNETYAEVIGPQENPTRKHGSTGSAELDFRFHGAVRERSNCGCVVVGPIRGTRSEAPMEGAMASLGTDFRPVVQAADGISVPEEPGSKSSHYLP